MKKSAALEPDADVKSQRDDWKVHEDARDVYLSMPVHLYVRYAQRQGSFLDLAHGENQRKFQAARDERFFCF